MTKKIKEIDISSFRVYNEKQEFNFIHKNTGKVANLVAIYAPNGFGKTSFFDAIEWSITGTIGRFEVQRAIKDEVCNEVGFILKNKESNKENGSVKIVCEDDNYLLISTKKMRGNRKKDYSPGTIEHLSENIKSIQNERKTFCTTNLLAHNKITEFLQNYTAEDKTDELKILWDTNQYSDVLKNINELYNNMLKKKKNLDQEIKILEKELSKFKHIEDLNNNIFEEVKNYNSRYDQNYSIENYFETEAIQKAFRYFHNETSLKKDDLQTALNDNSILEKEYQLYETNKKDLENFKTKKNIYEKKIEKLNKIEKLSFKQRKRDIRIENILYLLEGIDDYYKKIEMINSNLKKTEYKEKDKSNYQKEIIELNDDIKNKIENNTMLKNRMTELSIKKESLHDDYYNYISRNQEIHKYRRLIEKGYYISSERATRIQKYSFRADQIVHFLEGNLRIELLYEFLPKNIIDTYNKIENLKKDNESILKNISVLENHLNEMTKISNEFQQLTIIGEKIVKRSKQNTCPLCHHKYYDYNELISKISTLEKNLNFNEINSQVSVNKKQYMENKIELEQLSNVLNDDMQSLEREYKSNYFKENIKRNKMMEKLNRWNELKNSDESICNNLKNKYFIENININSRYDVENKIENIDNQINMLNNQLSELMANLSSLKEKLNVSNEKEKTCELEIIDLINERNNIILDNGYLEIKNRLDNLSYYNPKMNIFEIKTRIENELMYLNNEKQNDDEEINELLKENVSNRKNIETDLEKSNNKINELESKINSYLSKYKQIIGEKDIHEENMLNNILSNIEKLNKEIEKYTEKSKEEIKILSDLNCLSEEKIWNEKNELLNSNIKKQQHLDQRILNLEKSKKIVEDFIIKKTNACFNTNIINQIYTKIDPHPKMKNITFLTNNEKGVLKTRIYTYDKYKEDDKISPVVYLSSAQVNVLSLSIFLSKVLCEKNTTFNTIFIDDPIQHLDGINILSLIDLLRIITTNLDRQIIIATQNEQFYKLLKLKLDDKYYLSKFIELTSVGIIGNN